jgi:hypothetical protein
VIVASFSDTMPRVVYAWKANKQGEMRKQFICHQDAQGTEKTAGTEQEPPGRNSLSVVLLHRIAYKHRLLPTQPFRLVAYQPSIPTAASLANRNFEQTDILHDSPHNGQARRFRGKGINLVGASPAETHKMSKGALRLHTGSESPLDSACDIWL